MASWEKQQGFKDRWKREGKRDAKDAGQEREAKEWRLAVFCHANKASDAASLGGRPLAKHMKMDIESGLRRSTGLYIALL